MERRRDDQYVEKLIKLNRVAKVVKGGRRFSFSALTVVGDRKGQVGFGFGKANDVSEAIRKSMDKAKKSMITVPVKGTTVPHEIVGGFKSASVLIMPAAPGTGIIAGGPVRAIMEACGINDIMCKSLGSKNTMNILKATFVGLSEIMDAKVIARNRGKKLSEMWG